MAGGDTVNQYSKAGCAVIDRETGLAQYEGVEEIYRDVLENFAKNNRNTLNKLNDALSVKDIKLAHRTAHSLRGAAGTIGAARLSDAAFAIEIALNSETGGNPGVMGEESFCGQMKLLEKEFTLVFDELDTLVADRGDTLSCPAAMDREKMMELIDKLSPYLETGDTKCLEYLGGIEQHLLAASEVFKLFIIQMEQFEFEEACGTVKIIRRFMLP